MTIVEYMLDYDHQHAVTEAQSGNSAFNYENMESVLWHVDGENDGPSWIALFKDKNGSFWRMVSGCDYTGWDCQASGYAERCDSAETAFSDLFMPRDDRQRDPEGWEAAKKEYFSLG